MYYEDRAIKAKGLLENGTKTGVWNYFYPSGKISSIESYKNDFLHGTVKYYDDLENLIALEQWYNGIQEDSSIYYYPNGLVEKKGIFKNSLYQGKWLFFHENGALKRIGCYSKGLPQGDWKFYNDRKVLIQKGAYEKGLEQGEWRIGVYWELPSRKKDRKMV